MPLFLWEDGAGAGAFLIGAFVLAMNLIDSGAIVVGDYGDVGAASSNAADLGNMGLVSIIKTRNINSAIDTILFDAAAVPAPGVALLMVADSLCLGFCRCSAKAFAASLT